MDLAELKEELKNNVYRFVDENINGLDEDKKNYLVDRIYRELMFFYDDRSGDWWEDGIENIRVNY